MPNEFPVNDPRRIWQEQPTEPIKMSLDEIRQRARQLQTKARLAALTWIALGLCLSALFARAFAGAHDLVPRIGYGVLSLWGLYGVYQAYRWIRPGRLAADATFSTSRDFYRQELERQRDYNRHIWRKSGLTLAFLGLALVAVPALVKAIHTPGLLPNIVPLLVLVAVWFVAFFYAKKRNRQKLQREIDEVKALDS